MYHLEGLLYLLWDILLFVLRVIGFVLEVFFIFVMFLVGTVLFLGAFE